MTEEWRDIEGYEGLYQVSNMGRVRSLDRVTRTGRFWKGRLLTPTLQNGYYTVHLRDGARHSKRVYLHRLVAEAFIPNPFSLETINHIDENPANNCVWNLEWMSREDNNNYGTHQKRAALARVNLPSISKKTVQYDLTGKEVAQYPSLSEASRMTGLTKGNISSACRQGGTHTAGGFIWRFSSAS